LSASNLQRAANSSSIDEVRGMSKVLPRSSMLLVAGMFAITACPPFGPFFSELLIVRTAFAAGQGWAVALFLVCLLLAFFGLSRIVFSVVDGRPRRKKTNAAPFRESAGLILPPLLLLVASLWLGLFTPDLLKGAWSAAVLQLFPTP
ncbi:MAG: proton-conducting transporter membrane subunit, partial [Desulfomicrobium sp.]|nr:proton-conducting transporter membrane subunit [Desulfomicrobium sp.]